MSIHSILSLAGGELDPALHARTDQAKYATGLKTLRNGMVLRTGGATSRPGTEYVTEITDSANPIRLIPFFGGASATVGSATICRDYIFEFGDLYMRPYHQGEPVREGQRIVTGITHAAIPPVVTTSSVHAYSTGDQVVFEAGPSEAFRRARFKITVLTATTFSLQYLDGTNVDMTSEFTDASYPFTGLIVRKLLKITTTITQAMLPYIRFAQYGPTLLIAHQGLAPSAIDIVSDITTGFTWGVNISNFGSISFTGTNPFSSAKPGVVGIAQQRLIFGNLIGDSSSFLGSLVGALPTTSAPTDFEAASTNDDQPFDFTIAGNQVQVIRHILDLGNIIILTNTGEWVAQGDSNGIVTPSAAGLKQQSYNGASHLAPVIVDNTALFVQASGSIVRDLGFQFDSSGYKGNDLTIFSAHLFDGYEIVDWAFQKTPTPIVWAVRDDGVLLGLTYVREQQLFAWHRHDTDGEVENVCAIPEGNETAIYLSVKRTINGETKRYIERLAPRVIDDISDFKALDSCLTYDGRMVGSNPRVVLISAVTQANPAVVTYAGEDPANDDEMIFYDVPGMTELNGNTYVVTSLNTGAKTFTLSTVDGDAVDSTSYTAYGAGFFGNATKVWDNTTMTLSGGTTWVYTETLTLTASSGAFSSLDIGNEIHLTGSDGEVIRFTIDAYTSATVVTGRANRTVPASMRSVAITTWARAVDTLSGLAHLEGKDVSVFADGNVIASPNNPAYDTITVTDGQITLDDCYGVIQVGLPFTSDIETLDIDSPQGEASADKKMLVGEVTLHLVDTMGLWLGAKPPSDDDTDALEKLTEARLRGVDGFDSSTNLFTGKVAVKILPEWNSNGRVFIRQVDPVPWTIAAIKPTGKIPFK